MKYHMRHSEKKITNPEILFEIIQEQKYMTIAMCNTDEPYLVTLNYAFDEKEECFFFHCAPKGKKIDYLKKNPVVWGQVVDDKGYDEGECDHAFRTLHFKGTVEFIKSITEKKQALYLMIHQLEKNPERIKQRFINESSLKEVMVGKITVQFMHGKANNI